MGMFKDLRNLQKQANEMVPPEHRGLGGALRMAKEGIPQMSQALADMQGDAQKAQYLAVSGRPGTARIDAVRDTGITINDNPTVEFDLAVSIDGAEPYAVTMRQNISRIAIGSFQPGATVPVKVDPADPQSLVIA
ncbi:MAG TPA: hypothetical protein VFZ89_11310 [Solirubrobacteraceae bacterium]